MALESVLTLAVGNNVLIPFVTYLLFVLLDQFSNLFEGTSKNSRRIDFQRIMALKMLLI
jgi:hypothetical protein